VLEPTICKKAFSALELAVEKYPVQAESIARGVNGKPLIFY